MIIEHNENHNQWLTNDDMWEGGGNKKAFFITLYVRFFISQISFFLDIYIFIDFFFN